MLSFPDKKHGGLDVILDLMIDLEDNQVKA